MPTTEILEIASMITEGERELGAFLRATADLTSPRGIQQATDLWLQAMSESGCPGPDYAKFFRHVTQRAAASLAKNRLAQKNSGGAWHLPVHLANEVSPAPTSFKEQAA